MQRYQAVLLAVWRDACRHIEIGESARSIARSLAEHLPLARLIVSRVDAARHMVEVVAAASGDGAAAAGLGHFGVDAATLRRLCRWLRRGETALLRHGGDVPHSPLRLLIPSDAGGDVFVGPLGNPVPAGALVLVAQAGQRFSQRHQMLMQVLLEPFAVALENDLQLREVRALREAAEAQSQSLLTKLGRKRLEDPIVGAEGGLRSVLERVARVAPSDLPVLLFGETGTGKELLARAIHLRSPRADGPFHRVNCGAIPPELIDSELFGHERGAFTGAERTRRGWFERADGGTLFLDEIGELPPAAQVRLLRILQDGNLERVGGQTPMHVDVRIVAATHRNLTAMVEEGRFREDLWYRIAVFPIVLPPLRERKADIPALAAHFAQRAAIRFGLPAVEPTAEDVALLAAYHWPGNIRELATVIDRAAILGDGRRLEVAQALGFFHGGGNVPAVVAAPDGRAGADAPVATLDEVVRRHIEYALTRTAGRIEGPQGVARLLDVNPHTLRARMRKLGVDWRKFRKKRDDDAGRNR